MSLYDIELIEAHGGSLRCYIKNIKDFKKTIRCRNILNNEFKKLNINSFKIFNNKIIKEAEKFKYNLLRFKKQKNTVIGYGAPARVSTITNFANIDSSLIDYIIDDSPLKQNRYSPGKHIRILPKKKNINNKIQNVIVFAYEYFDDIKIYLQNDKNYLEIKREWDAPNLENDKIFQSWIKLARREIKHNLGDTFPVDIYLGNLNK